MSDHDPLCETYAAPDGGPCICLVLEKAREDARKDLASAIGEQLRINTSLGVPESLPQSEFLRGQAHAWVHVLGLLEKREKEA